LYATNSGTGPAGYFTNTGGPALVTNVGNVGIGTTAPADRLSVSRSLPYPAADSQNLTIIGFDRGNTGVQGAIGYNDPGTFMYMGTTTNHSFAFRTNNTERMRIDSGGNIGIGLTNPGSSLHIARTVADTNYAGFFDSQNIANNGVKIQINNENGNNRSIFELASGATPTTKVWVGGGGNVGIGTTVPSTKLEVAGTVSANAFVGNGAGLTGVVVSGISANAVTITANGVAAVVISSNGSVGIGTTTANSSLYVVSPVNSSPLRVVASTNIEALFVSSNGNVGIGTTSPLARLDINGLIVPGSTQTAPGISVRGQMNGNSNDIEWGHLNPAGYGSTIGFLSGSGSPYIAFNGEAGTNANTFKTRGKQASIIISDLAGGIKIGNTAATNADNQTVAPLVTVLGGGNVGIGTTGPGAQLHVYGATDNVAFEVQASSSNASGVNSVNIGLYVNSNGNVVIGSKLSMQSDNPNFDIYRNSGSVAPVIQLRTDSRYDSISNAATGLLFTVNTSGTPQYMTMLTGGNVGIGTTAPSTKLEVAGTVSANAFTGNGSGLTGIVASGISANSVTITANGVAAMVVSSNGNVSIGGLNSRAAKLEIHNNGAGNLFYATDDQNTNFSVNTAGLVLTLGPDAGATQMALKTAGLERMRIDTNGNVGIGTATPGATLQVNGPAYIGSTSAAFLRLNADGGGGRINVGSNLADDNLILNAKGAGVVKVNYDAGTGGLQVFNGSAAGQQAQIGGAGNSWISGNVGIGTTGPGSLLSLVKTTAPTTVSTNTHYLSIGGGANEYGLNTYRTIGFGWHSALLSEQPAYIGFQEMNSTGGTNGDLVFGTRASLTGTDLPLERVRITASGNVGIGRTNPFSLLDIKNGMVKVGGLGTGDQTITGSAYGLVIGPGAQRVNAVGLYYPGLGFNHLMNYSSANGNGDINGVDTWIGPRMSSSSGSDESDYLVFATKPDSQNYAVPIERMTISPAGNVGIGTTIPSATLTVSGNSNGYGQLLLSNPASASQLGIGIANANNNILNSGVITGDAVIWTRQMIFSTDGLSPLMTLSTNGNVGIGTTNPGAKTSIYTSAGGAQLSLADANRNWTFYTSNYQTGDLELRDNTAGSVRLLVDTAGNVGIGTTIPANKLQVESSSTTTDALALSFTSGADNNYTGLLFRGNGYPYSQIRGGTSTFASDQGFIAFDTNYNSVGNAGSSGTYLTEKMRIAANGKVGIGTGSPTQILDISTSANSGQAIKLRNTSAGSGATTSLLLGNDKDNQDAWIRLNSNANTDSGIGGARALDIMANAGPIVFTNGYGSPTELMRITAGGNVGIGTTTPTSALEISGSGSTEFKALTLTNVAGTAGELTTVLFRDPSYSGQSAIKNKLYSGGNDAELQFYTTSSNSLTQKMVIANNGNVGIGTASPSDGLEVATGLYGGSSRFRVRQSTTAASQAGGAKLSVWGSNGTGVELGYMDISMTSGSAGNESGIIAFATKPTSGPAVERMRISSDGNVTIASLAGSGSRSVNADANGLLSAASDARLKNILRPFDRGLADIVKITPQVFKWNGIDGHSTVYEESGFIAQDVEKAIPEAVSESKDGYKGLNDRTIIAALVNAVKDLKVQNDAKDKAIEALRADIEILKAKVK
jgi:hypothetical protein